MGYTGPNHTQIPNLLLDVHMADMKEAELKVTLAVARKTLGWHKQKDKLSLSQLMELTGLSRQGVLNGIDSGLRRGTIEREESGQSFLYSLVVNEVDQSTELTRTSQRSRPELVNEVDTQNKGNKYKEKIADASREESPSAHRSPSPVTPTEATGELQPSLVSEEPEQTAVTHRQPTKKRQSKPPTPPIADAPPSPEKQQAAACWEMYLEMIREYEPKIVLAFGRERAGINKLAKAGRTPEEIETAFRTLKKTPFWKTQHLSAQSLGQQMGAVLSVAEPQEAQVLDYAW